MEDSFFFFQAEDGIRDSSVTGVQTCALPILIREVHGHLLASGRGSRQQPGEFRASQNWIGGTRPGNAAFVPPPRDEVISCMARSEERRVGKECRSRWSPYH